jgi:hypothetical protein
MKFLKIKARELDTMIASGNAEECLFNIDHIIKVSMDKYYKNAIIIKTVDGSRYVSNEYNSINDFQSMLISLDRNETIDKLLS